MGTKLDFRVKLGFIIFVLAVMSINIMHVLAAGPNSNFTIDEVFLSENVETAFEFINSIIAIGIALLAFQLSTYLKGSQMEKGWKMVVISTVVFVIKEIYGALNAIEFIHITGMRDILEFVSMGMLLYGFLIIYRTYSSSD